MTLREQIKWLVREYRKTEKMYREKGLSEVADVWEQVAVDLETAMQETEE